MLLSSIPGVVRRFAGIVTPSVDAVGTLCAVRRAMPCRAVIMAGLVLTAAADRAGAGLVDFTGVDLATVSSPAGQDFSYFIGPGPSIGTVNVRLLFGSIIDLTTGETPDLTGLWASEHSSNLSPATFRFTFDAPRSFLVHENETLTAAEVNAFTLPSGTWNLLSMVNATSSTSGSTISFTGTTYFGPYGHYSISGAGSSFDFDIVNTLFFTGIYGSAISIDVLPEPGTGLILAAACVFVTFAGQHRRAGWRRRGPRHRS
jgi:hypothetical protein